MGNNPIYIHLTQNSRQLSTRMEWLLSACILGVTIALGAAYYAAVGQSTHRVAFAIYLAQWISSLGFVIVAPSLALIVAALFTGKAAFQEKLAEQWLTNISDQDIVDGYIEASKRRLRILRAIGIGLIPQTSFMLSVHLGVNIVSFNCWPGSCDPSVIFGYILFGCIPALIIMGILAAIGVVLSRLAVCTGVWVGLRWRDKAFLAAGGILLATWVVIVLLIAFLGFLNEEYYIFWMFWEMIVVAVIIAVIAIPLPWLLTRFARRGAYRTVERMRQIQ